MSLRRRTTPAKTPKSLRLWETESDQNEILPVCQPNGASGALMRPGLASPALTAGRGSDLSSLGTWTDRFGCLVLLFTSFFAIPLACQRLFYTALFAGLEVEGMTFHFFNDVFLLNLAFKSAQCIFKRLAFLNANLRQRTTPPNDPDGQLSDYRNPTLIFHKGQGGFPPGRRQEAPPVARNGLSGDIRFPKALLAYLWIGNWLPVDIQLEVGVSVEIQQEGL